MSSSGDAFTFIQVEFHLTTFLEPIGMSVPKFSTSSESLGSFKVDLGQETSLLCPAQGKPIPAFRLVFRVLHLMFCRTYWISQTKVCLQVGFFDIY